MIHPVPISGWTFFLVSIFLLSGCFPVALPASVPIALLLSCALGAPLAALGEPGRLVLSLSLSLSLSLCFAHLAVIVWLRFSVRLRFRVISRAGKRRSPRSHRSRLRTWSKSSAANQPRVVFCRALQSRLFRLHSCLQIALCVLNASAPTLPCVSSLTGRSNDAHGEERHQGSSLETAKLLQE